MAEPARKDHYDPEELPPDAQPYLRAVKGGGETSEPTGELSAVDDKAASPESLRGSEETGVSAGGTTADNKEARSLRSVPTGDDSMNYTGDDQGGMFTKLRSKINGKRKRFLVGGFIGFLIAAFTLMMTVLQGPLQMIQLAQLLQKFHISDSELFGDRRTARLIKHSLSGKAEEGRLGKRMNKYANKWEARTNFELGLKSVYSDPPSRRFIGYEVLDERKARDTLSELRKDGANIAGDRNGKQFVDLSDDKFRTRRSVIRTVTHGTKTSKTASSIGARLLILRGGVDFHPLKNVKRKAGDKLVDWYKQQADERSKRRKRGVNAPDRRLAGQQETDADGNVVDDSTADADKGNQFANEAKDASDPDKRKELFKKIASGGAIVAVAQALCVINDVGNNIEEYNAENNQIAIRMGMERVTAGGQYMSNIDTNIDEAGFDNSQLYDEETDTTWLQDKSIRSELGLEGGVEIKEKPGKSGKPKFFEAVGNIPYINGACGLSDKAKKIPLVGRVIKAVENLSAAAVDTALKPFGYSIAEFQERIIRFFAGEAINTYAQGAELGGIVNAGVKLGDNDAFIAKGGRALNKDEAKQIDKVVIEERKAEMAGQSFYARVLDPVNVDSIASTTLLRMPQTPRQAFVGVMRAPANLVNKVGNFGLVRVGAQSEEEPEPYDYGFPEFGFSEAEQQDERFENPYENAEIIEANNYAKLREGNKKYGDKCFGMTIDPESGDLKTARKPKRYDEISKQDNDGNNPCTEDSEDLLRYRFYLADTVNSFALACYEDDEEACRQVGFNATVDETTSGDNPGTAAGKGIEGDPYTDGSGVACAEGTNDKGPGVGWVDGEEFAIRLCEIPNLPYAGGDGFAIVNSRVSGAWFSLATDAFNDAVELTVSSSYRTMAEQEVLWNKYGQDPSRVARPGYSSHQAGVALDIADISGYTGAQDCGGGRARDPGNQRWDWLEANARNYGFKQYSAEAWHWDAYPSGNRC